MRSQRDDFVGGLQTVLYKHREIEHICFWFEEGFDNEDKQFT